MIENIGNFKDFSDGTIKSVYDIGNNKIIEISVLYNKDDKDVVCVPTHYFCNLGCKMCHLTNKGLNKAMLSIEIEDFIYCLMQTLKKYKTNKKRLLISFMGVGEPLLNINLIKNVFYNQETILDLGYDYVSFAISTMMPNNNIIELMKIADLNNIPIKVHFSLHTPIDKDRKELIPSTNVSVEDALKMLKQYEDIIVKNDIIMENYREFHKANSPIEIHYTLIEGVNDGSRELEQLIQLLKKYHCTIKFIRFNPINNLKISKKEKEWISILKESIPNLRIKSYSPPGRQVGSSCGEFTKHYYHMEIETEEELKDFEEWFNKHRILE